MIICKYRGFKITQERHNNETLYTIENNFLHESFYAMNFKVVLAYINRIGA